MKAIILISAIHFIITFNMSIQSTKVKLSNGLTIPILGLGTWKSEPGKVTQAVKDAIDAGYRHIDCALVYGNENEVGKGIKEKIDEGVVKREDLFVTSKLWNTFHRKDLVPVALNKSLKNLGLNYLDLYLIHWPTAYKDGDDLFPKGEDDKVLYSNSSYIESWQAMEELVEAGLIKSIGVSNFNSKQINDILKVAKIPPVVNQVECHPYLNQEKLREFCESKGIKLTSYSPLGSPDRPWAPKDDVLLMNDTTINNLAQKYKKTPAQILIKYQIERGIIVIPKSVSKDRIIGNSQVFDFHLEDADIQTINTLNKGLRYCHLEWNKDHEDYPFKIEF